MKDCICLLCYKPNTIWFDFLSKFTHYPIFIMIDDNSRDYKEEFSKFSNITILQINDEECIKQGFRNVNFKIKKPITSWEKSIYYFSIINTEYNNVWFMEHDVFLYNEETLINIDKKYDSADLLCKKVRENTNGHKNDWLWSEIDIKLPPPYFATMVCCVRMSSSLLSTFRKYANEHNTLFFLEALFPTLCMKHDLKYTATEELHTITCNKVYKDADISVNNLYHPIKDITKHTYYRDMLKQNRR